MLSHYGFKPPPWHGLGLSPRLESTGGSPPLLDRCWLPAWHGHPRTPTGGVASDYDRACDIEAPLGLLAVGAGYGVAPGDEPLGTAWFPDPEHRGGMIVRWRYAPDRAAVIAALARSSDDIWTAEAFSLPLPTGQTEIFASAYAGEGGRAVLTLTLVPGVYRLETVDYAPNDDVTLLPHRLVWAGHTT